MVDFFFDTYAIIELLEHNPSYSKYNQHGFITCQLNQIELYWWTLQKNDEKLGQILLESINPVEITKNAIASAMKFRHLHKKRNLSYTDAIGYAIAQEHGLRFLTGDNGFKDLPNVEFVK